MQQKTSASPKIVFFRACQPPIWRLLTPDLEAVELPLRYVCEEANKPITHSYFIEYGLCSIIAGNGHKRLEVGLIGCEGMTGLPIVLGHDRSPNETFMQVAGNGIRIPARQAARSYFTKSITRTRASRFRSCLHESDRQLRAGEWHRYCGRAIGKMASDGQRPTPRVTRFHLPTSFYR